MLNKLKQTIALSILFAAAALMVACGGDESDCPDGQANATVNGNSGCYTTCTDASVCGVGEACTGGVCVPGNSQNNVNNTNNMNNTNNANNVNNTNNTNNTNNVNNTNNTNNGNCVPSNVLGACDTLCQTGCDAATQTCVVGNAGGAAMQACQPVGTATEGMMCDQNTPCAAGLGCFGQMQGGPTTCAKFCRLGGGEPACAQGDTCTGFDPNVTDVGLCVTPMNACAALPDDCAPAGEKCYPTNLGLQCVAHSGGALGDACTPGQNLPCGKELLCAGQAGAEICRQLCDVANPTCPAGTACQPLMDQNGNDFIPGVGACG